MYKTTLGELGKKLPVGFIEGNKFNREFSFRELEFGVEREIQKTRAKERITDVGRMTTFVLAKLLTSLGGKQLDPNKPAETEAVLARCWMADVLYMWLWARYESCGPEFQFPFGCPQCGHTEEPTPTFDMAGIDVQCPDKVEELRGTYPLKTKMEVRGQNISAFRLQPPIWSTFLGAEAREGDLQAKLLMTSICGTDMHESIMLVDAEVNKLKRRDYMGIGAAIDKLALGPKLVVEHECERCKFKMVRALEWDYDSFFV
jgi:hypothetical protein